MDKGTMRSLRRMAGGLALLSLVALPARAQTPTPGGTKIKNTATVTYKDANNNSYNASAADSVFVGFAGGIELTGPGAASPSSPTTGATYTLSVKNVGNG